MTKIDGSIQAQLNGIGEYKDVNIQKKAARTALATAKIALHILLGVAAGAAVAASIIFCPITLIGSAPLAAIILAYSIKKILDLYKEIQGVKHLAPSMNQLIPGEKNNNCPKIATWDSTPLKCMPFEDCVKTFEFKKKLIENAEKEILISGSYCGKQAFDEVLDLIEKRMELKPDLKVFILTATRFVTDKKFNNWTKITNLTEKFPERFFTELTFESFQANPNSSGFKYISNHTKLMVVDRKAMITGGSGIEDRWAYSDGLKALETSQTQGIVNASIAKTFRDKDFLIFSEKQDSHCETSIINSSVFEFYKLFSRWHHFGQTSKKDHKKRAEFTSKRTTNLPSFHNFYQKLSTEGESIKINTLLTDEQKSRSQTSNRTKLFMSGPEQTENEMEKELISLIDQSKQKIVINHMYFHPTKGIRKALKQAVKRGIQVDILTNHYTSESPACHKVFSPRSINSARVIARKQEKSQNLVNLYYWNVKQSTNHQKVIVIDDRYILCGSSNLGYKGFNSMSDYEHNILIDSEKLAGVYMEDFNKDLEHSKKYSPKRLKSIPSLYEIFATAMHYRLQSKIG